MPYVFFAHSVTLKPSPALARLLWGLVGCAEWQGHDLTVTCGAEGHGPDDPHTLGEALDVRLKDLPEEAILGVYRRVRQLLGTEQFYTQIEAPPGHGLTLPALLDVLVVSPQATALHLHLQRRKGTVYPPAPRGEVTS